MQNGKLPAWRHCPHTDMSAPVYRSIDISKKNSFSSGLALLKEFDSTAKMHILQRLYRTN